MNRKLIRPTLAEVKGREPVTPPPPAAPASSSHRERSSGGADAPRRGGGSGSSSSSSAAEQPQQRAGGGGGQQQNNNQPRGNKRVPPAETNAEFFYYKKQMDSHTPMVIVLQDGEEVEGTIEWYDRHALKVNRKTAPNILLLKHNIKYMYKADERESEDAAE